MADDNIKVEFAGFGVLNNYLGENNVETTQQELVSLFDEFNSDEISVNDFAQSISDKYGLTSNDEMLGILTQMASNEGDIKTISKNDLKLQRDKEFDLVLTQNPQLKQDLISMLDSTVLYYESAFQSKKDNGGLIARAWDNVKNTLGIGAGSDKLQAEFDDIKALLEEVKKDPSNIKLKEAYEKITGNKLDGEEFEKICNEETDYSKSGIIKSVSKYTQGQKQAVNTISSLFSAGAVIGLTALGIVAAPFTAGMSLAASFGSIALLASAGTAAYMIPQVVDGKTEKDGYDKTEVREDLLIGSFNSIVNAATLGSGQAIGKAIAKKVGNETVAKFLTAEAMANLLGDSIAVGDYALEAAATRLDDWSINDEDKSLFEKLEKGELKEGDEGYTEAVEKYNKIYGNNSEFSLSGLGKTFLSAAVSSSVASATGISVNSGVGNILSNTTQNSPAITQIIARLTTGGLTGFVSGASASFAGGSSSYLLSTDKNEMNFLDWLNASTENVATGAITGTISGVSFEALNIAAGTPSPSGTKSEKVEINGLKCTNYTNENGVLVAVDIDAKYLQNYIDANSQEGLVKYNPDIPQGMSIEQGTRTIRINLTNLPIKAQQINWWGNTIANINANQTTSIISQNSNQEALQIVPQQERALSLNQTQMNALSTDIIENTPALVGAIMKTPEYTELAVGLNNQQKIELLSKIIISQVAEGNLANAEAVSDEAKQEIVSAVQKTVDEIPQENTTTIDEPEQISDKQEELQEILDQTAAELDKAEENTGADNGAETLPADEQELIECLKDLEYEDKVEQGSGEYNKILETMRKYNIPAEDAVDAIVQLNGDDSTIESAIELYKKYNGEITIYKIANLMKQNLPNDQFSIILNAAYEGRMGDYLMNDRLTDRNGKEIDVASVTKLLEKKLYKQFDFDDICDISARLETFVHENFADKQATTQDFKMVKDLLLSYDDPLEAMEELAKIQNNGVDIIKMLKSANLGLSGDYALKAQRLILSCNNPEDALATFSQLLNDPKGKKVEARKLAVDTLTDIQNNGIDISRFLKRKTIQHVKTNNNGEVVFMYGRKGDITVSYDGKKIKSIDYSIYAESPREFYDKNGRVTKIELHNSQGLKLRDEIYKYNTSGQVDKIEFYNGQGVKFGEEKYSYKDNGGYIKTTTRYPEVGKKPGIEVIEDYAKNNTYPTTRTTNYIKGNINLVTGKNCISETITEQLDPLTGRQINSYLRMNKELAREIYEHNDPAEKGESIVVIKKSKDEQGNDSYQIFGSHNKDVYKPGTVVRIEEEGKNPIHGVIGKTIQYNNDGSINTEELAIYQINEGVSGSERYTSTQPVLRCTPEAKENKVVEYNQVQNSGNGESEKNPKTVIPLDAVESLGFYLFQGNKLEGYFQQNSENGNQLFFFATKQDGEVYYWMRAIGSKGCFPITEVSIREKLGDDIVNALKVNDTLTLAEEPALSDDWLDQILENTTTIDEPEQISDKQEHLQEINAESIIQDTPKPKIIVEKGSEQDMQLHQLALEANGYLVSSNSIISTADEVFKALGISTGTLTKDDNGIYHTNSDLGDISLRVKGADSMQSKLIKRLALREIDFPQNTKDALNGVNDAQGIRIIMKNLPKITQDAELSDDEIQILQNKQNEAFVKSLIDSIKQDKLHVSEIENYTGEDGIAYLTEKNLDELKDAYESWFKDKLQAVKNGQAQDFSIVYDETGAAHLKEVQSGKIYDSRMAVCTTKTRKNGYTGSNISLLNSKGENIEIQLRGSVVNKVAQAEHIIYDAKQGKESVSGDEYSEIRKTVSKIYKDKESELAKAYDEYFSDVYRAAREIELGIREENDIPKIDDYEVLTRELSAKERYAVSFEGVGELCKIIDSIKDD